MLYFIITLQTIFPIRNYFKKKREKGPISKLESFFIKNPFIFYEKEKQ